MIDELPPVEVTEERAQSRHALAPLDLNNNDAGRMVVDLWHDVLSVDEEYNNASKREVDFALKHDHYERRRQSSRDWRHVQPTTPDLFHTIRHKTSEICDPELYIDCRPVDNEHDALAASVAKSVIEYNVHDPLRRFHACIRRMVMGALAGRTWYTMIEWDPECGPYGNVVFRNQVPWRVHRCPGFVDSHDPQCPWVIEELDMKMADIWGKEADGWDVEGVHSDGNRLTDDDPQGDTATSGSIGGISGYPSRQDSGHETAKIIVWRARKDNGVPRPSPMVDLPPEEQLMGCPECGYATQDHPRLPDGNFPPEGDGCPQCMAAEAEMPPEDGMIPEMPRLQLVSALPEEEGHLRNIIGRMVVVAPNSTGPGGSGPKVLYDGPWDCPARSFPMFEYKAYDHPFEPHGVSDTFLHWTQQIMLDMCLKSGFLQLMRNGDVIIAPYGGLQKADGTPFQFTGEHGNIAYAAGANAQFVKHFQGSGISPGLPQFYSMVRDMMLATQGTSDLSMGPAEIKQARVGVVQQAAETGEIPVREGQKMLRESCSIGLGVVLDFTIHYWTEDRWVRTYGPEGLLMMQLLSGRKVPNMDVIITAEPHLDAAAMEQLDKLIQWATLPLPTRRLTAKLMNLPASTVEQFEREMLEMADTSPLPEEGEEEYDAAGGPPQPMGAA